jgi:hypothetical protein
MKCALCEDSRLGLREPSAAAVERRAWLHLRRRRRASPLCNAANDRASPRMPKGFKTEVDKDGWRH